MANLKEIRTRITSVNSTMQITSAMKMVSAAKLKRAQNAITRMRPFAQKQHELLGHLTGAMAEMENKFVVKREVKNVLLICVTSNRGLCGAFNANITKEATKMIRKEFSDVNVQVLPVGKKAYDFFRKAKKLVAGDHLPNPVKTGDIFGDLNFNSAGEMFKPVMDAFWNEEFDAVYVIYNQFKNAASQYVTVEKLLPIEPEAEENGSGHNVDYLFQPDKLGLLEYLIPVALKTSFYKALLDSHASEHGARMTAMHKATDNASDLLADLKLTYNKARQAAITTEILEIVGGAEALEG
ncbi:MAG: ATP synthase F1 subunit gamma [Flavobacteriales bacterium]|nr:ATP synthase F1 subunit gamma [Flavobacteriales bacterium]